jgi:hypothetical protein
MPREFTSPDSLRLLSTIENDGSETLFKLDTNLKALIILTLAL